jgi:hypothetical protein
MGRKIELDLVVPEMPWRYLLKKQPKPPGGEERLPGYWVRFPLDPL